MEDKLTETTSYMSKINGTTTADNTTETSSYLSVINGTTAADNSTEIIYDYIIGASYVGGNEAMLRMGTIFSAIILLSGLFGNVMILLILGRLKSSGSSLDVFFMALAFMLFINFRFENWVTNKCCYRLLRHTQRGVQDLHLDGQCCGSAVVMVTGCHDSAESIIHSLAASCEGAVYSQEIQAVTLGSRSVCHVPPCSVSLPCRRANIASRWKTLPSAPGLRPNISRCMVMDSFVVNFSFAVSLFCCKQ